MFSDIEIDYEVSCVEKSDECKCQKQRFWDKKGILLYQNKNKTGDYKKEKCVL